MKRERLEDLGRIAELMRKILRDEYDYVGMNPLEQCQSKHTIEEFINTYKHNEDKLEDLHNWLRYHKEKLEEIDTIAWGYDFEE